MTATSRVATRAAHPWYTKENIYCLIGLYLHQKQRPRPIRHDELDRLYARFLKEIDAAPTALTLKDKMMKAGDSFVYGGAEDSRILLMFNLMDYYTGGMDRLMRLKFSEEVATRFRTQQFQPYGPLTHQDIEAIWAKVNADVVSKAANIADLVKSI